MQFKTTILFLLGICLYFNANSQEKTYELLWEISGKDFKEKSYVFGSMHLNDSRIFEFGDSLYHCISQCTHFTNEINFDSISSLLTKLDMKELIEKEMTQGQDDKNLEKDETGSEFDVNGFFTVLDMQLYNTAKHLGLSIGGLERLEDQLDILDELSSNSTEYDFGEPQYEKFIQLYRDANLIKMEKYLTDNYEESELNDDYALIERNTIQANSIISLGQKQPTFSVVGAAHLFGENNVLDFLRNKGYKVRLVGYGKDDDRINNIKPSNTEKWIEFRNSNYGYKQAAPPASIQLDIKNLGKTSLSFEYEKGLTYYTLVLNPFMFTKDKLNKETLDKYLDNKGDERNDYNKIEYHENELEKYYLLHSNSKNPHIKKFGFNSNVFYEQGVEGMSFSAIEHPNVEKYLNSITTIPIEKKEILRSDDANTFSLPFMSEEEYIKKIIEDNSVYDGGEILLSYVSYQENTNGSSFVLRHHNLSPGTIYPNIFDIADTTFEMLSAPYNCILKDGKITETGNRFTKQITCTDSLETNFFLEFNSRGNQAILRVESTTNKNRNSNFFQPVSYNPLTPKYDDLIKEKNKAFTISAPKNIKKIDNSTVDNYSKTWYFSDNHSLSSGSISLVDLPKYYQDDINEEYFKDQKETISAGVDSLLAFDKYFIKETAVGYKTKYMDDSCTHYTTEMLLYNETQELSLSISFPLDLMNESPEDEIINSLTFEFKKDPLKEISRSKSMDLFRDLQSLDTTIFYPARNSIDNFKELTTEDLKYIEQFLNSATYDEKEEYNSKYKSISMLHDIGGTESLKIFENTYLKSKDDLVKSRILQSLAVSEDREFNNLFFSLINKEKIKSTLPNYTYDNLKNSFELFNIYKQDLITLSNNQLESDNIMNVFITQITNDSINTLSIKDSTWLYNQVDSAIDNYISTSKEDNTEVPKSYIMKYLRTNPSKNLETKLYKYIETIQDPYINYLLAFNQIYTNQKVDTTTINRACSSIKIYYYILELYTDNNILHTLPSKYIAKEKVAECIAINHWYETADIECDRCEIQDEIFYNESKDSKGKALILKCFLEGKGTEEYYLGMVGNFDENELFDMYDDSSGYYSELKTGEDSSIFHQDLIDYYNSQMNQKTK